MSVSEIEGVLWGVLAALVLVVVGSAVGFWHAIGMWASFIGGIVLGTLGSAVGLGIGHVWQKRKGERNEEDRHHSNAEPDIAESLAPTDARHFPGGPRRTPRPRG